MINPAYEEPPPIPLIEEKYNSKSEQDFVTLKLHKDPTSNTSDSYEFNISLFDHGYP